VAIIPKRGWGSNLAFMMNIVKYNSISSGENKGTCCRNKRRNCIDMQFLNFLRNSNNMQGLQVTYNMTFVKNIERIK
jgi:hypothetical protein